MSAVDNGNGGGDGDGDGRLEAVRTGRYAEWALVVVTVVGLVAASVHWLGLVLAGVLLGLIAPSLSRAFVYGITFGGIVLLVFAAWLAIGGAAVVWAGMGLLFWLSVAIALAVPTAAAVAVRAVV